MRLLSTQCVVWLVEGAYVLAVSCFHRIHTWTLFREYWRTLGYCYQQNFGASWGYANLTGTRTSCKSHDKRRGSVWFAFAIADFSFSGGVLIRMEDCSFGRDVLKWKSAQAPFTRGLISIWKYGVSEGRDDSQAHLGFVAEKLYLQEFRLKHVESSMPIIFA